MRALLLPVARIVAAYPTVAKPLIALAIMAVGWGTIPLVIHAYGFVGFVALIAALFIFGFWLERHHPDPNQG
jgi:hypothetical protein